MMTGRDKKSPIFSWGSQHILTQCHLYQLWEGGQRRSKAETTQVAAKPLKTLDLQKLWTQFNPTLKRSEKKIGRQGTLQFSKLGGTPQVRKAPLSDTAESRILPKCFRCLTAHTHPPESLTPLTEADLSVRLF